MVVATTTIRTPLFVVVTVRYILDLRVVASSDYSADRNRTGGHLRPWLPTDSRGTPVWHASASAQNAKKPEGCPMVRVVAPSPFKVC